MIAKGTQKLFLKHIKNFYVLGKNCLIKSSEDNALTGEYSKSLEN